MVHNVSKLLKLLARYGEAQQMHVVYEAGPTLLAFMRTRLMPLLANPCLLLSCSIASIPG
jgi:hypothetical protein